MTLTTTPDPATASKIRRLERREEFREAFSELLGMCDRLLVHVGGGTYRYEELGEDLEQVLGSEYPSLQTHEIELITALARILARDPQSNEHRLRETLKSVLECPELNEDTLEDVTVEVVADAEGVLLETKPN